MDTDGNSRNIQPDIGDGPSSLDGARDDSDVRNSTGSGSGTGGTGTGNRGAINDATGNDHDGVGEGTYDDGKIAITGDDLVIRDYSILLRPKRILLSAIQGVQIATMDAYKGKFRIWGSGDFAHWYNLDWQRPRKHKVLVINTGKRIRPCITPDNVDTVIELLKSHGINISYV